MFHNPLIRIFISRDFVPVTRRAALMLTVTGIPEMRSPGSPRCWGRGLIPRLSCELLEGFMHLYCNSLQVALVRCGTVLEFPQRLDVRSAARTARPPHFRLRGFDVNRGNHHIIQLLKLDKGVIPDLGGAVCYSFASDAFQTAERPFWSVNIKSILRSAAGAIPVCARRDSLDSGVHNGSW
jgi:hypothetical protein